MRRADVALMLALVLMLVVAAAPGYAHARTGPTSATGEPSRPADGGLRAAARDRAVTKVLTPSRGGRVRTRAGAELYVPRRVLRRRGRVSVTPLPGGRYDFHISPAWSGRVRVTLPLARGRDAVVHHVGEAWLPESARLGQRSVWVTQLSLFSTLRNLLGNPHRLVNGAVVLAKCAPRITTARVLRCLRDEGVEFVGSEIVSWAINRMTKSCRAAVLGNGAVAAVLGGPRTIALEVFLTLYLDAPCIDGFPDRGNPLPTGSAPPGSPAPPAAPPGGSSGGSGGGAAPGAGTDAPVGAARADILQFEPFSGGSWVKVNDHGGGAFGWDGFAVRSLGTPTSVVELDYNRDGRQDLLHFEPFSGGAWTKVRNDGGGNYGWDGFAIKSLGTPSHAVPLDYNRDGHTDILQFEAFNGAWTKIRNNGNGTFGWDGFAVQNLGTPSQVVRMDYNRDGHVDLLAFEAFNGSWVKIRNNGNGTFGWDGFAIRSLGAPSHVIPMDYNGDGGTDLLAFEAFNGSWIKLRNDGNGAFGWDGFAIRSLGTPSAAVPYDYNHDGRMDILQFEPFSEGAWTKLRNDGNGAFGWDGFAVKHLGTPKFAVGGGVVSGPSP